MFHRASMKTCRSLGTSTLWLAALVCFPGCGQAIAQSAVQVLVSPLSVKFGNVVVQETSAAAVVTVKNVGAAPVTLTSFAVASPGEYAVVSGPPTTCVQGGLLARTASCTIGVTLTPASLGAQPAGTLSIATNSINKQIAVSLGGTGIAPTTLSAAALNFGNVVVGEKSAIKSFTLTNNQLFALNISSLALPQGSPFALDPSTTCANPGPLAAGATCTVALTMTPASLGAQPGGTLTINDDASNSGQAVTLTGAGTPQAVAGPASLSFPNQFEGTTSAPIAVTLTNEQNVPLTISSATITGADASDFAVTTSCPIAPATLPGGSSCTLSVTFTPITSGTRTATLSIADGAFGSPQTVSLTGAGVAPITVLPNSILNYSAPVGTTSKAQTITIKNTDVAVTFNVTGWQLTGDFIQTSTTCGAFPFELAPGASCKLTVAFDPVVGGTRDGQLQVYDTAYTSPQVVNLQGNATSPLTLAPNSLVFGEQKLGTLSAPKTLTLTNLESEPETFTLAPPTNFSAVSNCMNGVIAANSSCLVFVSFAPAANATAGPLSGTLTVTDSAPNGLPLQVSLTGSAVTTNPLPAVAEVSPGAGTPSSVVMVTITGNGLTNFNLNSQVTLSLSAGSGVSGISAQVTGAPNANTLQVTLTIAPNATLGERNIQVQTPLAGGGTETALLGSAFIVANPNDVFAISDVSPALGTQGQTLSVQFQVSGTGFGAGTFANFGDGVTVYTVSCVVNPDGATSTCTAFIFISNTTPVGSRTITLVDGIQYAVSSPGAFQIGADCATLVSVIPNSEAQGWSGPVTLNATCTNFLQGATQVSIGGGVIVGAVDVISQTQAVAQVAVPPGAPLGVQNVTISTGGEIATLANGFTITGATPALISVVPSSGVQGQMLDVIVTANAYTTFVNGQLQAEFGGDITVNGPPTLVNGNPQVVDINITIPPTANVGNRTVTLISGTPGNTTYFPFTFTVNPSAATITNVSPSSVPQGGQVTLNVTGSGTIWNQATTTAAFYPFPVGSIAVNEITIGPPTQAALAITVSPKTPPGNYAFYMQTGGQIVTSSITVYANTPSMTMSPANGMPGTSFSATFTGQFTNWGPSTLMVVGGQGVSLSCPAPPSTGLVTCTVTVAPSALPGTRKITFTTGAEIDTTYFNVTTTRASIFSIAPYQAPQNTTVSDVEITGTNTHFSQGPNDPNCPSTTPTTVSFGLQITVNSFTVISCTEISANITTNYRLNSASTPTPPGWQQVYVNTGSEMEIGGFLVDAPFSPVILSVDPSSGVQGTTETVTITGQGTSWVNGVTEAILGAGVTVTNNPVPIAAGPNNTQTATANISISPTAPVGSNSVVMITGLAFDSGSGFSVTQSPASIINVSPAFLCPPNSSIAGCNGTTPYVVAQLSTAVLTFTGQGTHWLQGETTVSFGPGISVDALTITSPTTAIVQITVLSTSPIGFIPLTASTDGEVVTLQQAIDVEAGYPTLLAINPTSGAQGGTYELQVLGRFTNWTQGVTTLTFNNQDITASNVNVIDPQNLTATINVSPLAYNDNVPFPYCGHVLFVTTGSEQVSTNPILDNFCVTPGPAQIDSVSSLSGAQGTTQTVTITGGDTHFEQGVTTVSFGDPNFQVGQVTVVNSTTLTVPVAVSTSATSGYKTVTVSTLGEIASQPYSFTVIPDVATLNEAIPNQLEQGAQNMNVVLVGQYTHWNFNSMSVSTATFGPGITVNSVTPGADTFHLIVNISIDPLANVGGRSVTVTTPNLPCNLLVNSSNPCPGNAPPGSTGSEIVTSQVFSIVKGPAIITSVAPGTGSQGANIVFNVTGSGTHWQQNFTQFYIAGGGTDITINSVLINSATSATVDMNIAPAAHPGARSIFMITGGEALSDFGAFVITGGIPAITYLSPNNATPGTTGLEVIINGINTNWTQQTTSMPNFGPGITIATGPGNVPNWTVQDNTHIEAVIDIDPAAQIGYRTVVVQTGAQTLTGNFLVAAPAPPPTPYISYYWPSQGITGQTLVLNFTGMYTHWDPGPVNTPTMATFGDGIAVNTFQVLSPTSATATITIDPNTYAGERAITFTTGAEVESAGFNVLVSTPGVPGGVVPTLTIVDPGSAIQGATDVTVNIIGQYTNFDATTTFTFGPGVVVNGPPTILGPTIATQSIGIAQLAALGFRTAVATTDGVSVSGPAGFTVTPSLATISAVTPNIASQGSIVTVDVTGMNTHWDATTVFQFGANITVVGSATVNSATDATVTISVPALAPEGATYVTAQTGGEIASIGNGFVVQAGTPLLLSSGPSSVPQQGNAVFTILSQATQWLTNPPTVTFGAGVTITSVQVTGNTSLTVNGFIQPTAYVGYRDLTVSSGIQVLGLSNALYISQGPAAINSLSPNTAGQGASLNVQINGTNTNWQQGVTQLTFPGALINSVTVNSPTSITANITISDYAPAGQVTVTATTLGEVATGGNVFTITQTQPELLAVVPSAGIQGGSETVTLTGAFTHFSTASSVANFGAGVNVESVNAIDLEHLQANITVQPTTTLGPRNVSVTTGAEVVSLNNAFQVNHGPAAIANLSPATGAQGSSLTVTVTGSQTNFAAGITTAAFGGGINVTGVSVTDLLHANVTITIPASTPVGQYDVTLTTAGEVATILGGFSVVLSNPQITAVNPPTGHQGDTNLSIALTGQNTHWANGSSMASFGAGITVNSLTVTDATDAVASISIDQAAGTGSRNVTVTTNAETATITGGFSVLAGQPHLVSATPSSAQAGSTLNVVIDGEFTTFQQGFSTVSLGQGITVNSVAVNSITELSANIGIALNATLGARDITVTTNSQTETLSGGFTVTAGTPAITQINPNIGVPSQTVTVTITGQFTSWAQGTTTASFGPQIGVGGAAEGVSGPVTVTSPTTLTATISIDPNAAFGPVDVIVTTGAEIETVPAGFTVQPVTVSPPTLVSLSPGAYSGGMPINSNIVAVFSQPMNRATINTGNVLLYLTSNPGQGRIAVPGTVTLDASGLVATFTPTALLAVNSTYDFELTGSIQDASGNPFSYYEVQLYTVFAANTTAPAVVAANPPANAANVGTNVAVQIEFGTDMDQATQQGLTVSAGGNTVSGSWSWNSNAYQYCYYYYYYAPCGPGSIETFTPSTALQPNTTYTVSYGAPLADTAGNAVTPGSFTFTTGNGADTANNSATFDSPAGTVGTNFAPKVTFAKPANPLDINTSTLFLYNSDSDKYLKGTVSVSADGLSATFTPSLPLLPNNAYTVYMSSGYGDMDGNYLSGTYGYFTTGAGAELTPPQVASVFPADTAASVPLNTQVVVHFSEAIDPTSAYSITLTPLGGTPVNGTATLESDQVTLIFVPTTNLLGNTQYTVQVSGYADMVGNQGAAFSSSFSTTNSVAPLNLSTGLDASGNLITTGDTPDAHWVVTPQGSSTPQPLLVETGGQAAFYPGFLANGPNSSWVAIDPDNPYGNDSGIYSTTFNLSGYNLSNLCLVGSYGLYPYGTLLVNGTPLTASTYGYYSLLPLSAALPQAALNAGQNTLSLQWTYPSEFYWGGFRLQASVQTCNAVLSGGLSVTSATPAYGATGTATNTSITIAFNNPIDPATVNSSTVLVFLNGLGGVAGSYQVSGNQIVFTPDSPFPPNTSVYVEASGGPYDTAGDVASGYLDIFTTGGVATPVATPFQVTAFTPSAGASSVGLNAPVVATFNRSVNPGTIDNPNTDFALFQGDGQSPWCQGYSKSQDGSTLRFSCGTLPASATMTAMLNSNLQDFNGDALANFSSQFTTAPTDSATAGTFVTTRPGTGSSGIGVNQPLTLFANLPINPASVNAGLQVAQNNVPIAGSVQILDNGYTLVFTPSSPWTPGALVQWWTTSSLTDATYNNSFTAINGDYFYVAADTTAATPTVQAMSPADGATIPLNTIFDIQFNTPLNPTTVNPTNIYIYDYYTGLNVTGTYSMPQPNEVRIVPSGNLNPYDYYLLGVTPGLQSTTSVPAAPISPFNFSYYSYTSLPLDTTPPTIVSAVPFNGATNVGVNVQPGVVFSKAIDPVSVNSNTFQVAQSGTPLPGTFWISSDDTRVEFVPNAPLPASTSLTMTLSGVLDREGNPVTSSSGFQTGPGPDLQSPTVLQTSIPAGGSVPVNTTITVQFSESMDITTFSTASNFYIVDTALDAVVPSTLSWSADQTVAYLTPNAPLAAGREYYLYVYGGTDLAGNAGSYYFNAYYVYFYADLGGSAAPTVVAFDPINGATGLGTNTQIEAEFSAPIDATSLTGVTLTAGGNTVPTNPILSAGNTVVQIQPQTPLAPSTTYVLTVAGVKDPAGNMVATATSTFTTGATFDLTPPTVVSFDPPNYATVGTNIAPKVLFSKPLNPITVSNSTFTLYLNDTGQFIPLNVTLSANGTEVTLQPQNPLLPNTLYYFQGYSFQDQDGNYGSFGREYFYTGNGAVSSGPTVVVSPLPGATGIPLNAQVLVTASALIDPTSWSQNSIQLLDPGNHPVPGTVSLSGAQTLTFVPGSALLPGATYTVNVSGFTDTNGNPVAASSTTFTTGAAAGSGGLTLTSTNITPGAANVAANQQIVLTFSQVLDPTTINTTSLPVSNGYYGPAIAGTYAVSGNAVTFTPLSPYPAGATIYVYGYNGVTDVLGDTLAGQQLLYFTVTTATPDQTPLQVISVSPANGATGVRHDLPVSVTFNKSIKPGTVYYYNSSTGTYVYNAQLYAGQDVRDNGSVTMSADNRTLTFNSGVLQDATTYTIGLPAGGITDMSGNALGSSFLSSFTTATNPGTSAQVQSAVPSRGASAIPTDTLLTLYLTSPVNPATLAGNLTVTVNGQVYGGSVQSTASGYEVQFTPGMPFPGGAVVQWFLTGDVQDVNGNIFTAANGTFYTAAAVNPATASPQVVAVSPALYTSSVPTNAEVDIEYNLPIDPTTLSGNVISEGASTPFTVALASPNVIRITPNPAWSPADTYAFCTTGSILGTNGVATQPECYWASYFTTGSGPDTNPGTVQTGPPNGAVNVGTNAFIRLQFSKPVDLTTVNSTNVQVSAGATAIPGTWTYNYRGQDVIGANFYPLNPLPPSSPIQVSATGLLDYAGNTFAAPSSLFTTAPLPDFTSAGVTLDFPYGQTGIATNANFTCRYSKPIDPSSITPAGVFLYSYVTGIDVPVTYAFSADMMSVTMTPTSPLFAASPYAYSCYYALDLTGNAASDGYAYFTTGNGAGSGGPVLLQANPPNGFTNVPLNNGSGVWAGTSLGLLFSEPVSADSLSGITLTPSGGSPIPISVYPEFGNTIVAVQLPYVLQPNTMYTYGIAGVTDLNGNAMTPVSSTFTTGSSFDFNQPAVTGSSPANGASNVDVNTQAFSVTFSEAMDPVLINTSEIYLRVHNTQAQVPGTVTISPDYTTVSVTPTAPLEAATIYDLVYWPNDWYLSDIAGNPAYGYGVVATFTTNTPAALNGVCGSANGQSFAMAPTANLCSAGAASAVTNPGAWSWSCNGQYGGTTASCSASVTLPGSPVAQPSGLVSWWPGNDSPDDIIGGNNGTLENGASYALGEVGDAFSFNGSDQYVLVGQPVPANLQIQNAITFSQWIYLTRYPANGSYATIVGSEDNNTTAGAALFVDGEGDSAGVPPGAIEFDLGNGSAWTVAYTTTQAPLNQWVLVTAAATANNPQQIYFDGVLQPSKTSGPVWNGAVSYNGSWFAIGQTVSNNWPFTGLIDEVQVYNVALTAAQIQSIYNAGSAGMNPVTPPAENGVCGSANGQTLASAPTANLCSVGTASAVSSSGAGWSWTCAGQYGGTTASCSATSSSCAAQPAGLVSWWPGNGNTNDIVGGNNGTFQGTVSYSTGEVGDAFNFGGTGDMIATVPAINTTPGTQVTVTFWVYLQSNAEEIPFGAGTSSYDNELVFYDGSFGFNIGCCDILGIGSSGFYNNWVFVASVWTNGDPHNNLLYINGVQQTLTQREGTTPNSDQLGENVWIGGPGSPYYFAGLVDEVQVYNGALTAAQVQSIYNAGSAGVCQ